MSRTHVLVDEGRGDACLATAASTADTMDVVLDLLRHVEVDHVLRMVSRE